VSTGDHRKIPVNLLGDIYDGQVWKDFQTYKGQPFLSQPHNIALMMNCDWFQPFDHSQYSVGVLYFTILNHPHDIRFKPENVIIAGIIPGPNEPNPYEINLYLRPLVKELNALWTEEFLLIHNSQSFTVHAMLLVTVCDIPATSKIDGFLGHSSKHACWKCKKINYSDSLKRVNFSGVETGLPRTHEEHKSNAVKSIMASTPTEQNNIESENGSRFSELMYLPYYDCVRFAITDPMHNLFLVTAK